MVGYHALGFRGRFVAGGAASRGKGSRKPNSRGRRLRLIGFLKDGPSSAGPRERTLEGFEKPLAWPV